MSAKDQCHRPDMFERDKSLQQLEGKDWGEPSYNSHLVRECHRLRRIPLCDFSVENLRVMIGQDIGLEYLVPLALERLQADPYVGGDLYPGDLLVSVLRSDADFWRRNQDLLRHLVSIAERATRASKALRDKVDNTEVGYVDEAYTEFKRRQTSED